MSTLGTARRQRRARKSSLVKGFERVLLAGLLAFLAGCAAKPAGRAAKVGGAQVPLSATERELVQAWKADRGLSEGDAISNVMLRRYQAAGHQVRYAGDGIYEVLDKQASKVVVASFFVKAPAPTP